MDHYVTGAVIKALREKQRMTQADLAAKLCVSDKAVSKWENGRGFPDISLIEPLAKALRISVPELLSGKAIENTNRASNLLRSKIYVCPVCGNVIRAKGDAVISCCGISLPALEAEEPDEAHAVRAEKVEDEYFISLPHDMTKEHYISFFAYVTQDRFEMKVLYPEGSAEARFFSHGGGWVYWYCNRHGLFKQKLER
ncbi:MAG: helix-turn-helix domain-containing protein [Clostridia bacterium]|nr:helix-turn-helix domain-containing protein [Clostridia bacterium]